MEEQDLRKPRKEKKDLLNLFTPDESTTVTGIPTPGVLGVCPFPGKYDSIQVRHKT